MRRDKKLARVHGKERREAGVAYLILDAGAALRASRDLLDDPMPFVARPWIRPMVHHRLGAALHVDAFEVGVDELALVELGLDALPAGGRLAGGKEKMGGKWEKSGKKRRE